jgi:hypothetical protein
MNNIINVVKKAIEILTILERELKIMIWVERE